MRTWVVILALTFGARVSSPALWAEGPSTPPKGAADDPSAALRAGSGAPKESQAPTEPAPKAKPATNAKPTSDEMVKAAKDAKAKRKSTSTKVLTNADVKKSKAKLIETAAPKTDDAAPSQPQLSSLEQQDLRRKERIALAEAVATGEKKVASLERSAEELELRYYQENDPTYRDEVIRVRFDQAKRQLDEARLELANARDALKKIEEPTP